MCINHCIDSNKYVCMGMFAYMHIYFSGFFFSQVATPCWKFIADEIKFYFASCTESMGQIKWQTNKLEKEDLFRKFLRLCRKPWKAQQSIFRVNIATVFSSSLFLCFLCVWQCWTHGCPTAGSAEALEQQEPMWNLSENMPKLCLLRYSDSCTACHRKTAYLSRQIIY